MARGFLVACVLALATMAAIAGEAPAGKARLGMNLAGPSDWATELPFVDVFRMSRAWISQKRGAGWGQGPALEVDEYGWVKKLDEGCFAETPLCTISGGHYPGGKYTVLYEGEGTIEFGGDAKKVEERPGRVVVDVDSSRGGFWLRVAKTNPANYIRNIRVIMPGFESTHEKDPFHPAFLKRWEAMACFRFMDWMHTNGSKVSRWDERPTLRHSTFSKHGVALEWMIELCNRTKIDPWFCMPHLADDDFVRRFAQMTKERLDPSLKVYVEYSNEVWNGQFEQAQWAMKKGQELKLSEKPWEAGWRFTAQRSVEIFRIWEEVFGGRERLVRVLPSQAGNGAVSEAVLSWRDAYKQADALAVAPYMPYTIGRGKNADMADKMKDWTATQMLDHFEATAFKDSLANMRKAKSIADKYGVKLIAYEGGQHMVAMVKDQALVKRITATMMEANRHPRMGQMYTKYLDEWAAIGGDVFAVFSSISRWSNHGCWGMAEYYDSRPQDYPKYRAALEWAKGRGSGPR